MGPLLVHLVAWVEVSSVMTCGHTCSGFFCLVEAQIAQEEAGPGPGYGRRNVGFLWVSPDPSVLCLGESLPESVVILKDPSRVVFHCFDCASVLCESGHFTAVRARKAAASPSQLLPAEGWTGLTWGIFDDFRAMREAGRTLLPPPW